MSSRWLARGLAAGLGVTALPGAAFAAGGEALPFNQAFDTITSNLTGPTAKAVIIAAFFAGIVGVMVSHDRPWMRNVGTVVAWSFKGEPRPALDSVAQGGVGC